MFVRTVSGSCSKSFTNSLPTQSMASEESGSLVEVKDVEVKEDKGDTSFFLVAKWNGAKFDLHLPGSSTVGQVSKKSDSLCGSSRF